MMRNINNIPTLLVLKNILGTLKDNSSRFVYIRYSHTFYNIISKQIRDLNFSYTIIDFAEIADNEMDTHMQKSHKIPNFFVHIYQFLIELNPAVAVIDLFANIACDKFGYYLKKTDYQKLKNALKIRKKPGKYQRLKNIIIVNELQNFKEENIQFIEFLGYLAQNAYLPDTAVLVFGDKIYDSGRRLAEADDYEMNFTIDDFKEYTGRLPENEYLLDIIESLGVEYIDTLEKIYHSEMGQPCSFMEQIIKKLIENTGYHSERKELDKFLVICSYLFDEFTYTDIEQINKKIVVDYKSMLPVSLHAKILRSQETVIYSFSEKKFKEYFLNAPPVKISSVDAIKIINYLQEEYPFQYADLALVSQFMPLKESEKLSYFIPAYYHRKLQNLKYSNIIEEFLNDYPIGKVILLLEKFRAGINKYSIEDMSYNINKGLELLNTDAILSVEAKLCTLNYIADIAYEIIIEQKKLEEIFELYMKFLQKLNIFSAPNEQYTDYVLDAISFSTAIEKYSVQKRTNKLVDWLEKRTFTNLDNKIKFYRLGNLLYVLNVEKALDFTHIAYDISENNLILHEEARLNYSVSLMGAGKYDEAYRLLIGGKNFSSDYQNALQNNTIIAGTLSGKYSPKKVLAKYERLYKSIKHMKTSDCYIISNNYVSALLLNMNLKQEQEIERISEQIINHQDSYHSFFALNNLLILYYLKQDLDKFNKVLKQLQIPYLMRKYENIFKKRVQFLQDNFSLKFSYSVLCQKFAELNNFEQYAGELYFRPILWGLMERWFK